MPVIGRLDKQVEDILITPLDRKGRLDAPAETATKSENAGHRHETEPDIDDNEISRAPRQPAELPVWLL